MADFRNSNTSKYNEDWFIELSNNAKLLYYYYKDMSDKAGFIKKAYNYIRNTYNMSNEEIDKTIDELESKGCIIRSDDGEILYFTKFLWEQSKESFKTDDNVFNPITKAINDKLEKFKNNRDYFLNIECEKIVNNKKVVTTLGKYLNWELSNNGVNEANVDSVQYENEGDDPSEIDFDESDDLPF